MKEILFLLLSLIVGRTLLAQEKTALTKEETINYINKKVKECEGHYNSSMMSDDKFMKNYYLKLSLEKSGDKVQYFFSSSTHITEPTTGDKCDYMSFSNYFTFNPAHIKMINDDKYNIKGEPVGLIEISLISNTCNAIRATYEYTKKNDYGNCYNWAQSANDKTSDEKVYLRYLQSDPSNFNKIRKALEHLKALYIAEDDPFSD